MTARGRDDAHRPGATARLPRRVGGALCLDFANTVGGRGGAVPDEYLFDFGDLVAWGRHVGALDDRAATRLLGEAAARPDAARATWRRAIDLRETLYRVFSAIAGGERPPEADLDLLRRAYVAALEHAALVPTETGVAWVWPEADAPLDRPLWPVVRSAVELATAGDLDRLKECPGGGGGPCTWLFLDETKNAIRRWCSMAECGGEAKARRQTARRRAARARRAS